MGKHWGTGMGENPRHFSVPAARVLAAAGALALTFGVLNAAGPVTAPVPVAATAARGTSGSPGGAGALLPGASALDVPPYGKVGPGSLAPLILTDPGIPVAFPRPQVGSTGAGGQPTVSVGLTGIGRPPAGFLMAPLASLDPSSPFGFRTSPLTGSTGDFHLGQDYAAPCGTTVYAADSGVVRAAGWHPWGGGNRVEIDHGDGLITTYNHLESIAVRTGDTVQVGQAIARVGSTGWSTGCHLHFETILDGRYVSPQGWSLMTLRALEAASPEPLVSFAPGQGTSAGAAVWTIPVGVGPDPATGQAEAQSPAAAPAEPSPSPAEPQPTGTVLPPPGAPQAPAPATPSPTQSPSPSPTQSPSPTPTPSPSPTPTPSPSPTPTPSPSPTPTGSPTQSPSPTTAPTASTSPTRPPARAQRPSPTPTSSPTPTQSPAPAPSSSPTVTTTAPPTPAPTATPTAAPSPPTADPAPTGTATPEAPVPPSATGTAQPN
ncbi:hypothetical protein NtRootA9_06730 [Arthrobacter sp. NtRootA9]|nr:hypothetical protein NtRootA9_06730 [Arthrobacter sp. NtRootA9]